MDIFGDTATLLNSIVSNNYYGMPKGQICPYLRPHHPIIAIGNNRIPNGRRIAEKVHCSLMKVACDFWTKREAHKTLVCDEVVASPITVYLEQL